MGWLKNPGPTYLAGRLPAVFIPGRSMKTLSIFVDESGDFGEYRAHSPYYIIAMVFHDPIHDISQETTALAQNLERLGLRNHVVHTEPLIRREEDYKNLSPNERRQIFTRLFYFTMNCDIQYKVFLFHKKEFSDSASLEKRMVREISLFLRAHLVYFQSFDKVILYYDNGQHELNKILNAVFSTELSTYEAKRVLHFLKGIQKNRFLHNAILFTHFCNCSLLSLL